MSQYQQSSSNFCEHQSQPVLHILERNRYPQLKQWNRAHDECREVMLHAKLKANRFTAAIMVVLPPSRFWSPVFLPCLRHLTASDIPHHIHLQTENHAENKPSFPDNSSVIWATDTSWSHYLQFFSTACFPPPLATPGYVTRSKDWVKQGKGKEGGCTRDHILCDESLNQWLSWRQTLS